MNWVFLIRQTPYGDSLAREVLDMAYAAAAFDQAVSLVFLNDGVYQLLSTQDTQDTGLRNIGKSLSAAPMYEINTLFVEQSSMEKRGLTAEMLTNEATVVDTARINDLIRQSDKVMCF